MRHGKTKTVDVKLSGGWAQGGGPARWSLAITDAKSGLLIGEVAVTLENFALMISGLGATPATMQVFNRFDTYGKRQEVKRETIQVPGIGTWNRNDQWNARVQEAIPAELEGGWVPDYPTRGSLSQGQVQTDAINVIYRRYVEEPA